MDIGTFSIPQTWTVMRWIPHLHLSKHSVSFLHLASMSFFRLHIALSNSPRAWLLCGPSVSATIQNLHNPTLQSIVKNISTLFPCWLLRGFMIGSFCGSLSFCCGSKFIMFFIPALVGIAFTPSIGTTNLPLHKTPKCFPSRFLCV